MKRIISVLLLIFVLLSFAGCNGEKENNNSSVNENAIIEKEIKAAEEAFWSYYGAIKYNRDFVKASKYSAFDMNKIFEMTLQNAVSKKGMTAEQVYETIRKELNNPDIKDFESYMTAFRKNLIDGKYFTVYDQSKIDADTKKTKQRQEITPVDADMLKTFNYLFKLQRDSINEATMIDLSNAISYSDDDEFMYVHLKELKEEGDENKNSVKYSKEEFYLIKTEDGWKVIDFNIVSLYSYIFKLIK